MCPVARSLDVVGERWTLLIVRELLLGPKRFKDLLSALSAIGSNRLASRLHRLTDAGVVAKRTLPAPADVQVYELTEFGERLRPVVYSLGAWGSELPPADDIDHDRTRAELLALGLSATSPPELSAELDEVYEFHVADERFHVRATRGIVTVRSGPARPTADVVVECDLATFFELATGSITPAQAARQRRARVRGPASAFTRAFKILKIRRPPQELRLAAA